MTTFRIIVQTSRGEQVEQLILDWELPNTWVSFSPYIGHVFKGETRCINPTEDSLISRELIEPNAGDDAVVMRLIGLSQFKVHVGDRGKALIFRSMIPPMKGKDVLWVCINNVIPANTRNPYSMNR